jgi:hypothetical protein
MAQVRRKQPNILLIAEEVARQLSPRYIALGRGRWRGLWRRIGRRRILCAKLQGKRRNGKQEKCESGTAGQKRSLSETPV